MKSRTEETVESIDELFHKLRDAIHDLKEDVKWQPHMKFIVEEFEDKTKRDHRDFQRRFVDGLAKGWFY
jgi:fructose-1,6-bisphosphatase